LRTLLPGLCLGLCLALAGRALAQPLPPTLSKLHDDLRLTRDQEGDWTQYARAMDDGGQMLARRQAAERLLPQIPTPRRLALMEATMTQELADFHRQSEAIKTFYGRLTTDQQQTFDRDTLPQAGGNP
jgi:hypothetical protein